MATIVSKYPATGWETVRNTVTGEQWTQPIGTYAKGRKALRVPGERVGVYGDPQPQELAPKLSGKELDAQTDAALRKAKETLGRCGTEYKKKQDAVKEAIAKLMRQASGRP